MGAYRVLCHRGGKQLYNVMMALGRKDSRNMHIHPEAISILRPPDMLLSVI